MSRLEAQRSLTESDRRAIDIAVQGMTCDSRAVPVQRTLERRPGHGVHAEIDSAPR